MVDLAEEYKNDPQMRRVAIGLDVEHFIAHDKVGIYLVERAHQCRIEALEALTQVDAHDTNEIIKLQYQAKIPELFLQWLEEAVSNGISEEENIRIEDYSS